jgi:hypothetical protein
MEAWGSPWGGDLSPRGDRSPIASRSSTPVSLLLALTKCHRSPPTPSKVDALRVPTVVRGRGPRLRDCTSVAGTLTPPLAPVRRLARRWTVSPAEVRPVRVWDGPRACWETECLPHLPTMPTGRQRPTVTGLAPAYRLLLGSALHEPPGRMSLAPHYRPLTSTWSLLKPECSERRRSRGRPGANSARGAHCAK